MSDTPSEDPSDYEFDVAVSFAGEERSDVEAVIAKLNEGDGAQVRVFYDRENRYESWGKDLIEYFYDVYTRRARYVVMFISSSYVQKEWTRHERRTSLMRALRQRSEYILPVTMDRTRITEVEGLVDQTAFLPFEEEGPSGIADAIRFKLGSPRAEPDIATILRTARVAKNSREIQEIISTRPPAWEYLLWASIINVRREELADKRRNHKFGYGELRGERIIEWPDIVSEIRAITMELGHAVDQLNRNLAQEVYRSAVGERGEEGQVDEIVHMAERFAAIYEYFLDLASRLRGAVVPSYATEVLEMTAQLTNEPVSGIDSFIDEIIPELNSIPQKLVDGVDVEATFVVTIKLDNELLTRILREIERLNEAHSQGADLY